MVDFRPAFAIKCDEVSVLSILDDLKPKKDILKDFAELKDTSNIMSKDEAKE